MAGIPAGPDGGLPKWIEEGIKAMFKVVVGENVDKPLDDEVVCQWMEQLNDETLDEVLGLLDEEAIEALDGIGEHLLEQLDVMYLRVVRLEPLDNKVL